MSFNLHDLSDDLLDVIYQQLNWGEKTALARTSQYLSTAAEKSIRKQFKIRFIELFKQHQFGTLQFDDAFNTVPLSYLHHLETCLSFNEVSHHSAFDWYQSNNIFDIKSPAFIKLVTVHVLTGMGCYYINSSHLRLLDPEAANADNDNIKQYQLDIATDDQVNFVKLLIKLILDENLFHGEFSHDKLEAFRLEITKHINQHTHLPSIAWIYEFVEYQLQRKISRTFSVPTIPHHALNDQKNKFKVLINKHLGLLFAKQSNLTPRSVELKDILRRCIAAYNHWENVRLLSAMSHFNAQQINAATINYMYGTNEFYEKIIFLAENGRALTDAVDLINKRKKPEILPPHQTKNLYLEILQACLKSKRRINPLDILAEISDVSKDYNFPSSIHDFFLLMYAYENNIPLGGIHKIARRYYAMLDHFNYKQNMKNIAIWENFLEGRKLYRNDYDEKYESTDRRAFFDT